MVPVRNLQKSEPRQTYRIVERLNVSFAPFKSMPCFGRVRSTTHVPNKSIICPGRGGDCLSVCSHDQYKWDFDLSKTMNVTWGWFLFKFPWNNQTFPNFSNQVTPTQPPPSPPAAYTTCTRMPRERVSPNGEPLVELCVKTSDNLQNYSNVNSRMWGRKGINSAQTAAMGLWHEPTRSDWSSW